jgi:hypothetical protein
MKHKAPMTNVTTVNTSFMGGPMHFLRPLWSQLSSHSGLLEPLGTRTVLKEPGVLDRTT